MQKSSPLITASFGFVPAPPPTIGTDELAKLLGFKPSTFQRRRWQLIQAGMPRPIAGMTQRWSRAAVMAWINANGAIAGAAHSAEGQQPLDPVEAHRQHLEDRMGAGR